MKKFILYFRVLNVRKQSRYPQRSQGVKLQGSLLRVMICTAAPCGLSLSHSGHTLAQALPVVADLNLGVILGPVTLDQARDRSII